MRPQVSIIGLHPVSLTKAALLDNAISEFGEGNYSLADILDLDDTDFAERFADLYLVEVRIDQPDDAFDPSQLQQGDQVAYDEKLLNEGGTAALKSALSRSSIRLGFFLHFVDPSEPLSTPYGEVALPTPTPMPQRLARLFRYVPP